MKTKVAVIGAGNVGSHIVASALLKNIPAQFLLIDRNETFEQAQVLDMKDILLFAPESRVKCANFETPEIKEVDIFVITAGANQKPGENRCELLGKNVAILQSIKEQMGEIKPSALIIIVTNPVDILTQVAAQIFNLPRSQVFGTGTLLDSARLQWRLAERLERNIADVRGFVLGEHGDSEFIAWNSVSEASRFNKNEKKEIANEVMQQAYTIIKGKGATFFGIGAATADILSCIINDSKKILPLSCPLNGEYGIKGISLGVPAKVGRNGIEKVYEIPLGAQEYRKLVFSAEKLKNLFRTCNTSL